MNILLIFSSIKDHLFIWQTLIGSIIGAITPLFILWCAEIYKVRKEKKVYLYYLQRLIIDQINSLIDIRQTTIDFIDNKLDVLVKNIDENGKLVYSVDGIFFPLFSARSLPDDVNHISSGSGYIDNKIAKIYALSKDLPQIIDDLRNQLKDTLDRNEKIVFGRLNVAEVQKSQYKANILEYKKVIVRDLLGINIPIYLRKLVETIVAVEEKTRKSTIRWKLTFDPFFKYYNKKSDYIKARENFMDNMDLYFKTQTDRQLREIEEKVISNKK